MRYALRIKPVTVTWRCGHQSATPTNLVGSELARFVASYRESDCPPCAARARLDPATFELWGGRGD